MRYTLSVLEGADIEEEGGGEDQGSTDRIWAVEEGEEDTMDRMGVEEGMDTMDTTPMTGGGAEGAGTEGEGEGVEGAEVVAEGEAVEEGEEGAEDVDVDGVEVAGEEDRERGSRAAEMDCSIRC